MVDRFRWLLLLFSVLLLIPAAPPGRAATRLQPPPHGFFTALPKEFGYLVRFDGDSVEVVLDRTQARLRRKLLPGADVFHHGGPGTLADFSPGDRLWLVMEGNARRGERGDIRLLADELSVQAIHSEWCRLEKLDVGSGQLVLLQP